jgi:hypothetical protein
MNDEYQVESQEESGGNQAQLDTVKSYGAFLARALRTRPRLAFGTFFGIVSFGIVMAVIWPRTFTCETTLTAQGNKVLDGDKNMSDVLRGAPEVILGRENLLGIAKQLDLVHRWDQGLPPILALKQRFMVRFRGEPSEADKLDALVGLLGARISVTVSDNERKVVIDVDWQDGPTSAAIADAAEQSFLRARHVAEISTVSEYIAILEGHALELRSDIHAFAAQVQTLRDEKLAELQKAAKDSNGARTPAPVRRVAPAPARDAPPAPDESLPELKAELDTKQRALTDLEGERDRHLAELQARLIELKSKYTAAHPLVVDAQQSIDAFSGESPRVVALRNEVQDLKGRVKSASAAPGEPSTASAFTGGASTGGGSAGSAEQLPPDIMRLMQDGADVLDTAIAAQFHNSVEKYSTLRGEISSARVDLDTAQAAFKHRYQIVVPPETPSKPSKPSVPKVVGIGLFVGLLASLIAALIAELRTGKLVERWQIYQLGVPLLGELRWPPSSLD